MRADRLLSMMLMLQAQGRMTADDLALQLEVSERTIYRDIDALSTAGVPVYTQPGANGGIFLDENYRISLTGLSKSEVLSLFVASNNAPLNDLGMGKSAEESLLKLFAALPRAHRHEVERLRQRFFIDPMGWLQEGEPLACLPIMQQAVWEDRIVKIVYQDSTGETRERKLEAYGLVAKANIWYLIGKKQAGELRTFRASRVASIELSDEHFQRDESVDIAEYWKKACEQFERDMMENFPPYLAIVRVHPDGMWYFPNFMNGRYEQIGDAGADGWTTLRVTYSTKGDAIARVLGLGTWIEVLEPDELKQGVIQQARDVLNFYEDQSV